MNQIDELIMKAPLKTVLKNFLDHVDDLEARKKLCDDQYEYEFQELKKLTDKLKEDSSYPCSVGTKDVNKPKNRYKDIVPYDFSRVILPKHEGIPGSDYINASYIKGASGALAYIAAQGPLPNTVIDFWRMIWVCDVQVIVMACNETEAGKFKCEAYWPSPGEVKQYGNISIELVKESQVCPDFLVRTFLVGCNSEVRDVFQFHYTTWPDHGVPDTVQPILDLVRLMRDCQARETVPIVVHCSAGCGRTGTICAVDYVWACLRHGKLDEDFSLYQIALELRRQRIAMIQTKEQYILAHKAVAAMFEQQLRVIDCHIYENLDEDGEPLIWKEVRKDKQLAVSDFIKKFDTRENIQLTDSNKSPFERKSSSKFFTTSVDTEKIQESSINISSHYSGNNSLSFKGSVLQFACSSSKNSESSYSRNSILSEQSNEDSIPFIDDDDVCIRPNCGRAYLNIPSCNSISKIVNCFDPFVDKVSVGSDSSPDGDPTDNKIKDFSSKTLDKNAKISAFYDNKSGAAQQVSNSSDAVINAAKKSLLLSSRESYPPRSNSEKLEQTLSGPAGCEVGENSEDIKGAKKVGKATVVRRPSISKLKALFEKSGISTAKCCSEGSKRLLFRNNSHHVSRAGSAPPSLDCMDKSSAVEKESILKMVTRKFRSSSVRSEREMQAQQLEKSLKRRSATDTVKDGFNALTRTMSFNINKTFKSYSPVKINPESIINTTMSNVSEGLAGIYKPKSPDQPKGNSMWYDRSSLPRAVAVVKPSTKFDAGENEENSLKCLSEPKSPDKNKPQDLSFNSISKPAKFKDFFSSLNRKDTRDPTTLWYNESNADTLINTENTALNTESKLDNKTTLVTKSNSILPFLPIAPWKKVGPRTSLRSPDSPENFQESVSPHRSTFYANVFEAASFHNSSADSSQSKIDVPKCPVPEEIIPLNVPAVNSQFWPPNSVSSVFPSTHSDKSDSLIAVIKDNIPEQSVCIESAKSETDNKNIVTDLPPAIPKKMVIGKSKNLPNAPLDTEPVKQKSNDSADNSNTEMKLSNEDDLKPNSDENGDLYMNVNLKAKKNIEQIESSLRKNPRGAIIDLTSRESYSMEEELVNAVNQLSESSAKTNMFNASEYREKSKTLGARNNSKFPGYEVIWPEEPLFPIQKSKSSGKVPFMSKTKAIDKNHEHVLSNYIKTGLCYSPPLRRSVNASLELAKSQSCSNLDWLEPEHTVSGLKEQSNTPTKRLVNEAVVELNTLLNQLTTRTLSEDVDLEAKSKKEPVVQEESSKDEKPKESNLETNDTVVHSVTLVTKSYISGSSPKEEEIVFHFPPPPRVPPPKDESPAESFQIICKDGSLLVKDIENAQIKSVHTSKTLDSGVISGLSSFTNSSDSCLEEPSLGKFPQPAPRKSKQSGGIRRSSSYSNIGPSPNKNKGYENVFLEKYQTLSKLEIKPDNSELDILEKVVPLHELPVLPKTQNSKTTSNYVNVGGMHCASVSDSHNEQPKNFSKTTNSDKSKEKAVECGLQSVNASHSNGKTMLIVDTDKESHSVYGKILKVSDKKDQISNIYSKNINTIQDVEIKKKPIQSKKTERAPMPPNIRPVLSVSTETAVRTNPNNSMIPKKLPSRKLEKAPPPPHLLQKSSSTANVLQRNLVGPQPYVNLPPVQSEERPKLPAVRENVPNTAERSPVLPKNTVADKFVYRGLSHSQSDVSVFLALKERRIQSANQERKLLNIKSFLVNKRTKNEVINVSSSDSDSSYERIFFTKNDEPGKASPKSGHKEQIEQLPIKSYKKEIPVAPPRSKRRTTTEVQYTKMKSKDASHIPSTSEQLRQSDIKNSEDDPPAIPVKTKEAFEILE